MCIIKMMCTVYGGRYEKCMYTYMYVRVPEYCRFNFINFSKVYQFIIVHYCSLWTVRRGREKGGGEEGKILYMYMCM